MATMMAVAGDGGRWRTTVVGRVSSAKGVHIAESSFEGQNRKVHKMCAGYREIPDKKFRHGLGFGPIVNWFDPAPVLLTVMLRVGLGILVSTFVKGTG
jgi:hypothetical protein